MKKGDIILIIGIIVFSISSIFYIKNFLITDTDNSLASIQVNGKEVETIDLNSFEGTKEFETEYGLNIISVEDGKIRISKSDCPDQICVLQGNVHKSGETIVCLPNKFVIEIKGDNSENEIDTINR